MISLAKLKETDYSSNWRLTPSYASSEGKDFDFREFSSIINVSMVTVPSMIRKRIEGRFSSFAFMFTKSGFSQTSFAQICLGKEK